MGMTIDYDDLYIVLQQSASPLAVRIRLEVFNPNTKEVIGYIYGIVSGSYTENGESGVRRTCNFQIQPTFTENIVLQEGSLLWLDKDVRFYIEVFNPRKQEWKRYPLGDYVYTDTSSTFNATTNTLNINCSDYAVKLDGTKNGQIGVLTTEFPAYVEYIHKGTVKNIDDLPYAADEETSDNIPPAENDIWYVSNEDAYYLYSNDWKWENIGSDLSEYFDSLNPNGEYVMDTDTMEYTNPDETKSIWNCYYKYSIIRRIVMRILKDLAYIDDYYVDELGEYKGMSQHNKNYEAYREENKLWNTLPNTQTFSSGDNIFSMLTAFKDIYPGYEMFFSKDTNTFIMQMIPLCYHDDVYLNDDYIQQVLISETSNTKITDVRNICEVWGKCFETDFYAHEDIEYNDNIYTMTIEGYEEKYFNGDMVSIKIPITNEEAPSININNFGVVGLYEDSGDTPLREGRLKPDTTYTFQVQKRRIDGKDVLKFIYCGSYQVHALSVLTDGSEGEEVYITASQTYAKKYSEQYFKDKYNVNEVDMYICPDSPYTVQKIGELLYVENNSDNIQTDNTAKDTAHWNTWKKARLTDNITLTTVLLPWLEVNKKISYRPHTIVESDEERQYIITSISHDFKGFTTTISMYRFYPYYEKDEEGNIQVQ